MEEVLERVSCDEYLSAYLDHQHGETICEPIDGGVVLTMPFTYSDGDYVDLAVRPAVDGVVVVDLGSAISRLGLAGIPMDGGGIRERAVRIFRSYGVQVAEDEARLFGAGEQVGELVSRMTSALLSVDGLASARQARPRGGFRSQVLDFLTARFEDVLPDPVLVGLSGSKYTLTARVGGTDGVLVNALSAGGTVDATRQAATRAFRTFADVDGQLPHERKLVLLDDTRAKWRREDVALLAGVAYVGSWRQRAAVEAFLHKPSPRDRVLGGWLQVPLSEA